MKDSKKPADKYGFGKRWAPQLVDAGFSPVSNYFLENYHRLKPYDLTHGEAMFVIHLMQYKWDEKNPYPGYKTIAIRMGASDKTARRLARSLEDKKFLKRQKRVGQTNVFDFTGLINALVKLKQAQVVSAKPKKRSPLK